MRKAKKWLFVLTVLSLLIVLAACGGEESAENTQNTNTTPSTNDTNTSNNSNDSNQADLLSIREEKIELIYAQTSNGSDQEKFDEAYGNKLKEVLPNYTHTFMPHDNSEVYRQWIGTGEQIDLLRASIGHTPSMVLTYDLQQDISDLIKKYNFDLDRLEPSTIEAQKQYDGEIYGIPVSTTSLALFYNKDLFDLFGVEYPKDGMVWDELYELAKTMTRSYEGVEYRGLTMAFNYMLFLNQLSVPHFEPGTNNPAFTTDEFKKVFENFARFYRIPGNGFPNGKYSLSDQQNSFRAGKVAMLMTLSGANFEDEINWDVVQLPFFEEKMGIGPQSYPTYLYIPTLAKHRDAAFQVLMEYTSEEFQKAMAENGQIPVLKDSTKLMENYAKDNPHLRDKNIQAIIPKTFASPTEKTLYQSVADKHLFTAVQDYAAGKDINTVLREAEERVKQEIASQQGQ